MTRRECLEQAMECVLQNRQDQYGDVEDCFKKIARLWNAYLPSTIELEPFDVACMMALLKIARIQANPKHGDSWVDLAGYAACGADIAVPEPFRYDKPKAEGVEALVEHDAPQTAQELYKRIIDANPATFHTPSYTEEQLDHHSRLQTHKPTGEELAEMAEEETHG